MHDLERRFRFRLSNQLAPASAGASWYPAPAANSTSSLSRGWCPVLQSLSKKRQNAGFTLIELLLVISIVAILTAVAVFSIASVSSRSRRAACQADIIEVQKASDAYYTAHQTFAPDIATLVTGNLLRNAPSNASYTISLSTANGGVSSAPACSSL